MENLPSYYTRSTHEESRWNVRTIFTRRRIFILVACFLTLFLVFSTNFLSESFLPRLSSFLLSLKRAGAHKADRSMTISVEPSWEGLKAGEHCLRHATRQYTARLSDVPAGQENMLRACKETPVEIHGRALYTDFCQDLGFNRGVWGFWVVDFDETECETRWGEFTDVGCLNGVAPARRIESRLENLQAGDNWQFMCVTTPADIRGRHFPTPTECYNQGRSGIYGIWDLRDHSCGTHSQQVLSGTEQKILELQP